MKVLKKIWTSLTRFESILIANIVLITLYVWRQLPLVTLRADGYQYLIKVLWTHYFYPPASLINYKQGSVLAGMLLGTLIGVRVELYYWVSLAVMIIINLLIYKMLFAVTKNRVVSFVGAIFMAVNYFGNWAMYAQGIYAFLQERVVYLIFLIPSFIFLEKYLSEKSKKFLFYSIILYFFGIGMWHWGVIITALFTVYPILTKPKKNILIGLIYAGISVFFIAVQRINQAGIGPQEWTFTEFLLNPVRFNWPADIVRQLVYLNSYPLVINALKHFFKYQVFTPMAFISELPAIEKLTIPVIVLYTGLSAYIFVVLPKMRRFLITLIVTFMSVTFLNVFFGRYLVQTQAGPNRYLHLPALILSFYWCLGFWALFWRWKSVIVRGIGLVILGVFVIANIVLINDSFKNLFGWDHSANIMITYVRTMNIDNLKNTLIVADYPEFQSFESYFFNQYKVGEENKNNLRFVDSNSTYEPEGTWVDIGKSYPHILRLLYDKGCDCVVRLQVK